MGELSDRLIAELVDAVRAQLRKEQVERLRDVYLIGDIEKDTARACIERLKQMQDQIYKILSSRSGKPLRQIIRDTKRTDFYLDAQSSLDYGLIDAIVAGELPEPKPLAGETPKEAPPLQSVAPPLAEAAQERPGGSNGGSGRPSGSGASGESDRPGRSSGSGGSETATPTRAAKPT